MAGSFSRVPTHFLSGEQGPLQPRELTREDYSIDIITPEEAVLRAKKTAKFMLGKDADPVDYYEDDIDGQFGGSNWDEGLKPDLSYEYDNEEEDDEDNEEEVVSGEALKLKKNIEQSLIKKDPALDHQIDLIKQKQKESKQKATFRRG